MEKTFHHLEKKSEQSEKTVIENLLEKMFDLKAVNKINEGHHGIILELDFTDLSPTEKEEFCQYFNIPISEEGEVTIKMLKLYEPEKAEREFNCQVKAAELINQQNSLSEKVGVPECYFGGEISLTDSAIKEKLKSIGVDTKSDNFGVIMMDFIKGEDLGIYCYREFIKANFDEFKQKNGIESEIKTEDYDLYLNGLSIDDLILNCHEILGRKAKYHYLDNSYEAKKERSEISISILTKIENQGLINQESISALREAIKLLNSQGIFHRDLHLRNLVKDSAGKIFVVDFGSAVIKEGPIDNLDSVYISDDGEIMQKDESILNFLNRLAVTPEEAERNKIKNDLSDALRFKAIALKSEPKGVIEKKLVSVWGELQKNMFDNQDLGRAIKIFSDKLGQSYDGVLAFDYRIAALMLLADNGYIDEVKNFCSKANNITITNQIFLSKLKSLAEYLS